MSRTRAETYSVYLASGGTGLEIRRNHASGQVELARLLVDRGIARGRATHRIGYHRRAIQRDRVCRTHDSRVGGGRLAVGLLKPDVPALVKRIPIAICAEGGDEFR